jgi:hypothetical protein
VRIIAGGAELFSSGNSMVWLDLVNLLDATRLLIRGQMNATTFFCAGSSAQLELKRLPDGVLLGETEKVRLRDLAEAALFCARGLIEHSDVAEHSSVRSDLEAAIVELRDSLQQSGS